MPNITLNLLQPSRIQPKLSAYAQIYGPFDFNKNPLAPGGCALIIHERTEQRPAWANHGRKGFYISPAMHHYRNYKCYIPSTGETRFSNTVVMNPRQCALPEESPLDRLNRTLVDFKHIIRNPHPVVPLLQPGTALNQGLRTLHKLIAQTKPKPPIAGARVKLPT